MSHGSAIVSFASSLHLPSARVWSAAPGPVDNPIPNVVSGGISEIHSATNRPGARAPTLPRLASNGATTRSIRCSSALANVLGSPPPFRMGAGCCVPRSFSPSTHRSPAGRSQRWAAALTEHPSNQLVRLLRLGFCAILGGIPKRQSREDRKSLCTRVSPVVQPGEGTERMSEVDDRTSHGPGAVRAGCPPTRRMAWPHASAPRCSSDYPIR